MSIVDVIAKGVEFRHEHRDAARRAYFGTRTLERFELLEAVMLARRLNLKAANRRWLRRNGKSFNNT